MAIVTWPNGRIGDASRGIYTTSAAGLDKHLPISDYCCSMYTSLVSVIKRHGEIDREIERERESEREREREKEREKNRR